MSKSASKSYGTVLAELDNFLGQLNKTASGQGDKDTTHESKNVKDNTGPAQTGEQFAATHRDVSTDIGPQNIDDAAEATNEEPSAVSMTTATTTGKGVPSTKPVPGRETAKPGNAETEKGAEFLLHVKQACAAFGAEKVATELGNSLMADIAVFGDALEKSASALVKAAAASSGSNQAEQMFKTAMDNALPQVLQHVEKQAADAAVLLRDFYAGVIEGAQKKANEGAPEETMPGEAGGEGALPTEDIAQLASAAGGEGAAPVEGDAGGDAEVIEALSEALADAGITPEELVAAIQSQKTASANLTIEQKKQASEVAKLAMTEVNSYRNMKALGRVQVKKASIDLLYAMRKMVNEVTGK